MASQGPNGAGTGANDASTGTLAWNNPSNVRYDDLELDTTNGTIQQSNQITQYIKATNFGFTIPTGSTIDGIVVEINKRKGARTNAADAKTNIVKSNGSIGTTNITNGTAWGTSYADYIYGSSSNLWGETWSASDINDADFGVAFSASISSTDGKTMSSIVVKHIRITVYYTEGGGGGSAIKTFNGLAKASIQSVNGLAIASVKTINGLT